MKNNFVRKSMSTLVIFAMVITALATPLINDDSVQAATKKPAKVKSVKVKQGKGTKLKITWKKAKRAKTYQVAYKLKGAKKWTYKKTKKRSLTITTKKYSMKYQLKVRGLSGSKKGKWSSIKTKSTRGKVNKYADLVGTKYKTVAAAETAMKAVFNKITSKIVRGDGERIDYRVYDDSIYFQLYKNKAGTEYVIGTTSATTGKVIGLTKNYSVESFMQKIKISNYTYTNNYSIDWTLDGKEYSVFNVSDSISDGMVTPTHPYTVSWKELSNY